jgi:hypothetical protein
VIYAYFDDSGKEADPSNRHICMAGYMGSGEDWDDFEQDWRSLLLKHGIGWIHMKELIHFKGEYKELGWDAAKRDAVLFDFIEVIKDSPFVGFGVGVDIEAWALVPEEEKKKSGNAHDFCFQRIMRGVIDRLEVAAPNDLLQVVFDRDQSVANRRFYMFSRIHQSDPRATVYLQAITFANPKLMLGLQAADLLAWETRKEVSQKSGGFSSTERFKELCTPLPGHLEYIGEWWDKQTVIAKYGVSDDANAKGQTAQ